METNSETTINVSIILSVYTYNYFKFYYFLGRNYTLGYWQILCFIDACIIKIHKLQ